MKVKLLKDVIEDKQLAGFDFNTVVAAFPDDNGVDVLVADLVGANIDEGSWALTLIDGEHYYYLFGGGVSSRKEFEVIDED